MPSRVGVCLCCMTELTLMDEEYGCPNCRDVFETARRSYIRELRTASGPERPLTAGAFDEISNKDMVGSARKGAIKDRSYVLQVHHSPAALVSSRFRAAAGCQELLV